MQTVACIVILYNSCTNPGTYQSRYTIPGRYTITVENPALADSNSYTFLVHVYQSRYISMQIYHSREIYYYSIEHGIGRLQFLYRRYPYCTIASQSISVQVHISIDMYHSREIYHYSREPDTGRFQFQWRWYLYCPIPSPSTLILVHI